MSELTALDILKAARAKIARPEQWGQGLPSERPGRICAFEAIVAKFDSATNTLDVKSYLRAQRALCDVIGTESAALWNDAPERTHGQVLAAFDKAIAGLT